MIRILVTGGAGYIGSVLVPKLLSTGYKVTVLDNLMYNQSSLAGCISDYNLDFIRGDVRDRGLVKKCLNSNDIIIPLAAIVGAPACDKDPIAASSINRDAHLSMFDMLSKDQQLIMPTTNSAYGAGGENNYCDENTPLNPLSLYAKDKVIVEQKLLELENATSFRLATVFGISPRMRLDLLVNNFVYRALIDGYLVLFESHFKRNFIHVLDVVNAFLLAIQNPQKFNGQVFNVGLTSANLSKLELCQRIQEQLPNFNFFQSDFGQDPDQRNYLVSNKKIENFGFVPRVSLDDGIKELIKGLVLFNAPYYSNI